MTWKNWFVLLFVVVIGFSKAHAGVVVSLQNQEVPLPVNSELGTIVRLPGIIKALTPSKHYVITDLQSSSGDGQSADVRTFQIKPIPNGQPESVTFILAGGQAIALKLIATANADKYIDIQTESASKKKLYGEKFMGNEVALMRAMILDETGGFVRQTVEGKSFSPFDGVEFTLIRVYSSSEATGYVYIVKNRDSSPKNIQVSSLSIGTPNRAVVAQVDHEKLEPCGLFAEAKGCGTFLRLVVRGPKEESPSFSARPNSTHPFMKTNASDGGAK